MKAMQYWHYYVEYLGNQMQCRSSKTLRMYLHVQSQGSHHFWLLITLYINWLQTRRMRPVLVGSQMSGNTLLFCYTAVHGAKSFSRFRLVWTCSHISQLSRESRHLFGNLVHAYRVHQFPIPITRPQTSTPCRDAISNQSL